MAEGRQNWWRLTELSLLLTVISSKECNGGFLEVFLYNCKSAWGLVLERLLGMVWMKSQSQDGGKKRQRQRQQQIKILYRARTRRIVCEMTYCDYDTLRLLSKITEGWASCFRCLETIFSIFTWLALCGKVVLQNLQEEFHIEHASKFINRIHIVNAIETP